MSFDQQRLAREVHRRADMLAGAKAADLHNLATLIATEAHPGELARWLVDTSNISANSDNGPGPESDCKPVTIVTVKDFAEVDEAGAGPLVGSDGEVLIPEGGNVMLYGDGGSSKTTLSIDLGCHLAAGDDWLDAPIPKPVRVAIIEAEGPRPLFRRKLKHKLDAWQGSDIGDRLRVLETPWADFRFRDADEVAAQLAKDEVDVLIVGPLTRVGWDELGTLQEVRDFMDQAIGAFRAKTGRRLTIILIHHSNKAGSVSGAWEGAADTLLHAQVHARGKTTLTVQKARWSGEWHKRKLELAWTDGEGFEVIEDEERDLVEEIARLLDEKPWRTAKEISVKAEAGGIGKNVDTVKGVLEHNPERFVMRTGAEAKAVGRASPNAKVWGPAPTVTQPLSHTESQSSAEGKKGDSDSGDSPYRESPSPESLPLPAPNSDSTAESPSAAPPLATREEERRAAELLAPYDEGPT